MSAKKAKSEEKKQLRRETRATRKRRREEAGLTDDDQDDHKSLSEQQLDQEELAGDPSESEQEFEVMIVPREEAPAEGDVLDGAGGKMCAGQRVR